jgi:uncharacterized membrane protein
MTTRLILAAIAGSAVQFLLGWLVYGLLLMNFMSSQSVHYEGLMKDMNNGSFIIFIYLSGLAMSFLLTYVFQRWGKFDTLLKGLTAGMFFGLFMALTYDLSSYAMMNLFSASAMIVDILVSSVLTGIVGGSIAFVLGFRSKAAPVQ